MGGRNRDDMTEGSLQGLVPKGRPEALMSVVLRGALCVGEHGSEWRPEEAPRQLHSAIMECGYETLFALPPTTGEELWCRRCMQWERCRVIGGSVVQCADCGLWQEHGHDRHRAQRQARDHSIGRDGQRLVKHRARVGTHTREGIDWDPYKGEQ